MYGRGGPGRLCLRSGDYTEVSRGRYHGVPGRVVAADGSTIFVVNSNRKYHLYHLHGVLSVYHDDVRSQCVEVNPLCSRQPGGGAQRIKVQLRSVLHIHTVFCYIGLLDGLLDVGFYWNYNSSTIRAGVD